MDCLDCAIEIFNETVTETYFKIAVLNMANENHPGGGYLTGASAQEESLFRRTTLAAALHPDNIDGCNRKQITYPWKKSNIDVIFSENIEIFRHSEINSLQSLPQPYSINIISCAAIERPDLSVLLPADDQDFKNKEDFITTFYRWLSVFLSAITHKVTHLVISPMGCGAFRNPKLPHVNIIALLVSWYGKFFKKIVFTTTNDFTLYVHLFSLFNYVPKTDSCMIPCHDLFKNCHSVLDPNHINTFVHTDWCFDPQSCSLSWCQSHRLLCKHAERCKNYSDCVLHQNDATHDLYFLHAPVCPQSNSCSNKSTRHKKEFYHRALCKFGKRCNSPECMFHHKRHICTTLNCTDLTSQHIDDYEHPYPIDHNPFVHCQTKDTRIICCKGCRCPMRNDEKHCESFVHLERPMCSISACDSVDELHLKTFSHEGVLDFRPLCDKGSTCTLQHDYNHVSQLSHPSSKIINIVGNILPDLRDATETLDYFANEKRLSHLLPSPNPANLRELAKLIMRFRPVHRIRGDLLASSITHGAFYSAHFMQNNLNNPKFVADNVASSHYKLMDYKYQDQAASYLKLFTEIEMNVKLSQTFDYSKQIRVLQGCKDLSEEEKTKLGELAFEIAQAAIELNRRSKQQHSGKQDEDSIGINFATDQKLLTNRTIFSILGPNTNQKYGPVSVFFKSSLSRLPSSFTHMTAATMYYSHVGSIKYRPYIKTPNDESQRPSNYFNLIQNLGVEDASTTLAKDLCLTLDQLTRADNTKHKISGFDYDTASAASVRRSYIQTDSHYMLECHLPSKVSFTDVVHILMPKIVFDALPNSTKEELNSMNLKEPGFLVLTTGDVGSPEYGQHMIQLSRDSVDPLPGFNVLLTPHGGSWVQFPLTIPFDKELGAQFSVNAIGNFSFIVEIDSLQYSFHFNNGTVSLFPSAVATEADIPLASTLLYHSCRLADVYLSFAVVIDVEDVTIGFFRTNPDFKFDCLRYSCSQLKGRTDLLLLALFPLTNVELGLSPEKLNVLKETFPKPDFPHVQSPQALVHVYIPSDIPSDNQKPICKFPFTCKHFYKKPKDQDKDEVQDHLENFRHVCRSGKNCKDPCPKHAQLYIHFDDLPSCPMGSNCDELDVALHRFTHHHDGIDLIPFHCKKYKNCNYLKSETKENHVKRFGHWPCDSGEFSYLVSDLNSPRSTTSRTINPPIMPMPSLNTDSSLLSRINEEDFTKQNLDLDLSVAFVFDATYSMGPYIKQTSDQILEMAEVLNLYVRKQAQRKGYADESLSISFSFCAFRDIRYNVEIIPFDTSEVLATKIAKVKAVGGDDYAEDICTGLDTILHQQWPSGHRIIFIIGDAPNHGERFAGSRDVDGFDDYPSCDQNGIMWEDRFDAIIDQVQNQGISLFICPLKNGRHFDRMENYFSERISKDRVRKISLDDSKILDAVTDATKSSYAQYLNDL
ncbi:hypothetical protein GEMRC1_004310 [Eukaryota sp. GEM-RC1]